MEAVGVQELFRVESRAHFRDTHFRACAGPSVRVGGPGRKPSAFLADMGDMDMDMGTWRIGACDGAGGTRSTLVQQTCEVCHGAASSYAVREAYRPLRACARFSEQGSRLANLRLRAAAAERSCLPRRTGHAQDRAAGKFFGIVWSTGMQECRLGFFLSTLAASPSSAALSFALA